MIEPQAENFDNAAEANAYMATEEFAANPISVDFNPGDLIKRLSDGEDEAEVKKQPASKPRRLPEFL